MPNDIKRSDSTARLSDRLLATVVLVGLTLAAALLPLPWQLTSALTTRQVATSTDLDVVLDAVALGAASIAVWLLICWILVIGVLTLIARTPGSCGRLARSTLLRITPGFVRRSIAIGMSVGALTGVTIGTAPATAGPPIPSSMTIDELVHPSFPLPAAQLTGPIDRAALAISASAGRVGDHTLGRVGQFSAALRDLVDRPAEGSGAAAGGEPSQTAAGPAAPAVQPAPRTLQIDIDWPVHRPSPAIAAPVGLDWPSAPVVVVVHRGDTLWSIAARQLGPAATDAQIDTAWRGWYAANRALIGDYPDQILPGQQLHAPPAGTP